MEKVHWQIGNNTDRKGETSCLASKKRMFHGEAYKSVFLYFRLLELAQTITKRKDNKQVLDKLRVERERGITVKAQVTECARPIICMCVDVICRCCGYISSSNRIAILACPLSRARPCFMNTKGRSIS